MRSRMRGKNYNGRYGMTAMSAPNKVKMGSWYSILNMIMVFLFLGVVVSTLVVYFGFEDKIEREYSFTFEFNGQWLVILTFFFSLITMVAHFFEMGFDFSGSVDPVSRRYREYSISATIMAFIIVNLNSHVLRNAEANIIFYSSLAVNSITWLLIIYRLIVRNTDYVKTKDGKVYATEDKQLSNNWHRNVLDNNDYFGLTYTTVAEIIILTLGNSFGGFNEKHKTLAAAFVIPCVNYLGYWAETEIDFDEMRSAEDNKEFRSSSDDKQKQKAFQSAKYYLKTILAWFAYAPFAYTFVKSIAVFRNDYNEAPDFVFTLLILEFVLYTLFGLIHFIKPWIVHMNPQGCKLNLNWIFCCCMRDSDDERRLYFTGYEGYNTLEVLLSLICKAILVGLTYGVVFAANGMNVPDGDNIVTVAPITGIPTTAVPTEPVAPTQREVWEIELASRKALLSGECTYQQYISGTNCTNKAILLHNHDFYDGTLTLDNGGYFKLVENIVFDPNKDGDSFPDCSVAEPNPLYCVGENANRFRLGWFAAIAMRGHDVTLDLNYKTIQQGPTHYLRQRFYANIELADRPFLTNQGPVSPIATDDFFAGGFGDLNFCTNCAIVDGFLSRASHHGIHGSLPINAYVANLQIDEYEGACISINSLRDSVFYNIDCSGSFEQIQVQAQFSQSIFMLQLADDLLDGMPTDDVGYADLLAKRDALRELVQVAETWYINGVANSDAALQQEMLDLFDMPSTVDGRRVIGGNQYGIIVNSKGVAVNQFVNEPKGWSTGNHFEHLQINKVLGLVREVVSIREGGEGRSVDVAGGTWRIEDTLDQSTGLYVGDRLHDLRASVGWWIYEENGNSTYLRSIFEDPIGRARFGTWGIKPKLAAWAFEGTTDIQTLFDSGDFQYICNEDAMAHIQKGNHGLILQDFADSLVKDVKIYEVVNYGAPSSSLCGEYGRIYPSNQGPDHNGYSGCETRGLSLVASTNNDIVDVHINDVESHSCDAWGVQLWNGSSKNRFKNLVIDQVRTLADAKDEADFSSVDGIDFTIMNDM